MRRLMSLLVLGLAVGPAVAQDGNRPFAAFELAGPAELNDPHDLAIGPDGRLYVADKFASRIAVLDAETLEVVEVIADGRLSAVRDISFGPNGRVAVSVTGAGQVLVFDSFDTTEPQPSQTLAASRTEGVLAHSNGKIYTMSGGALVAFSNGALVSTAGRHLGAHDVAEDRDGNVWVADMGNRRLVKYSSDLVQLQVVDHPRFGFIGPRYMDFDEFGRIIVADQDAHRVLMIDPDGPDGGSLLGVLGNGLPGIGPGRFDDPEGIAVHDGRYYISDSNNNRIVRYAVVTN